VEPEAEWVEHSCWLGVGECLGGFCLIVWLVVVVVGQYVGYVLSLKAGCSCGHAQV